MDESTLLIDYVLQNLDSSINDLSILTDPQTYPETKLTKRRQMTPVVTSKHLHSEGGI